MVWNFKASSLPQATIFQLSSSPLIDDKDSRGRAMQAGAVAFLDKPFSDEQLLETVRSAFRHGGSSAKGAG